MYQRLASSSIPLWHAFLHWCTLTLVLSNPVHVETPVVKILSAGLYLIVYMLSLVCV